MGTKLQTLFIASTISYYFLRPPFAYSQIVINEVLPDPQDSNDGEWVELKNTNNISTDVNGYKLTDSSDNTLTINTNYTPDTNILAGGYIVIKSLNYKKYWLNNDGDTLSLFDSATESAQLDIISYTSSSKEKSLGRIPDGVGDFTANLDPTPGQPNQPPPTPTPTLTPTPTPSPTPTPTTSSTSNSTSSTPTPTPTTSSTPTPKPTPATTPQLLSSSATTSSILGITNLSASDSSSASQSASPSAQTQPPTPPIHPFFFIGSGLTFLLAATSPHLKPLLSRFRSQTH